MVIDFLTSASVFGDGHRQEDFALMRDYNDHTNWLNGLDDRLNKQQGRLDQHDRKWQIYDDSLKGLTETVKQNTGWIHGHTDWIRGIESQVKAMPQTLRETLDQILKESVVVQLDTFGAQLATLKAERDATTRQVAELHKLHTDMTYGISAMKKQCEEVGMCLADLQRAKEEAERELEAIKVARDELAEQVEKTKSAIPVPRWFAKFFFIHPKPQPKKNG